MLDIPPHIEQVIIATAKGQGVSVGELLAQKFPSDDLAEMHGLNSDTANFTLNEKDSQALQAILDNPTPPTPALQEILALGASYGFWSTCQTP